MSNETESLSAILASARTSLADDSWIDEITQLDEDGQPNDYARRVVRLDDVLAALERIEAAVEREARIREQAAVDYALKRGEDIHADRCRNCTERSPGDAALGHRAAAERAPSAAARNCDVGTAREQIERFNDFCRAAGSCPNCPLYQNLNNYEKHGFGRNECMSFWGQLPFAQSRGGAEC